MIWKPAEVTTEEIEKYRKEYSEQAEVYRKFGHDREEAVRFIVDSAKPFKAPVLDIGTGKGYASVELARRGINVTTIDISEEDIRIAYLNALNAEVDSLIEYHIVEQGKLPFDDKSFNLVTMVSVLHHLTSIEEVLPEISRVLIPGGRLLVSDFTNEGFEILDRIHEARGGMHPRANMETMDEIVTKMRDYNLVCVSRDIRFHQHVVLAERV